MHVLFESRLIVLQWQCVRKLNQLRTTGLVTSEKCKPRTSLYSVCINMKTVPVFSQNNPAISILLLLWCCKGKCNQKDSPSPVRCSQYLGQLFNFSYKLLAPFKSDFRTNAVGARQLQFTHDAAGLDALLHSRNNQ